MKGKGVAAVIARALGRGLVAAATLLALGASAAVAVPQKIDLGDRKRLGGFHRATESWSEKKWLGGAAKREIERQGFVYYRLRELSALDLRRGSIEITVRRTADAGNNYFPLVEFENGEGRVVLQILAQWNDMLQPGRSVLDIGSPTRLTPQQDVWGDRIWLPRHVQPGEEVTLLLTWGKGPGENRVYLDGQEAPAYVKRAYGKGQAAEDSPREGSLAAALREAEWMSVPEAATLAAMPDLVLSQFPDTEVRAVTIHPEIVAPGVNVAVASVAHDASRVKGFSGKLVAGNTLSVTVTGTPGATGTFGVAHYPDLGRRVALDWRGWGVYLEDKVFFEEGEVNLRDVTGYRVFAKKGPFNPLSPDTEPTAELLDVKEQAYVLEDLEIDTPYFVAVVAVMKDGTLRPVIRPDLQWPLAETEPGVYTGTWRPNHLDRYPRAVLVGRLASGEREASLAAAEIFAVDPTLTVAVATEPSVLKADEKSTAKVTVTVTDANGNTVPGHEIRFLLATTSQYTGVVGGGAFADQVGGAIRADHRGVTDLFGRITATYVAGFAAKTAVIVARDMTGGGTGAGHVQTYITGTAQLELEPVQETAAMAEGYRIEVTSSDTWLTADGKSQARITARVTLAGEPVAGHRVSFRVAGGTGSIRTVSDKTDRDGEARAVYTAGTKIGLVLITATDTTVDISGSVQIELRSDAPAKIAITLDPERLPADGRSRADVKVLVTDINDNPNDDVEVEYAITEGEGDLREDRNRTDRAGASENVYTAGRSPGQVSIEITVRSTVPTAEEIVKARDLAVAVPDSRFF